MLGGPGALDLPDICPPRSPHRSTEQLVSMWAGRNGTGRGTRDYKAALVAATVTQGAPGPPGSPGALSLTSLLHFLHFLNYS